MQLTELVGQQWKPLSLEDSSSVVRSNAFSFFLLFFFVGFLYIESKRMCSVDGFLLYRNSRVTHFISCT